MIFEKYDLVIIGAGICGLTIGKALTSSSTSFKIFEKSRAYGGRVATRRINGQSVDHGAQYFTVSNPKFRDFVKEYEELGIIKQWASKFNVWDGQKLMFEGQATPRYICPKGFTDLPKELAKVIPVSREIKITEANQENGVWKLLTDTSLEIEADKIISTAPLHQTLDLFSDYLAEEQINKLNNIQYDACLSVILVYENTKHIPWKGIFWNTGNVLSWVANDSSKRINSNYSVIVAQCQPEFSKKYFDSSEEEVVNLITNELKQVLPSWIDNPTESQVKKWRYSKANSYLGEPYLEAADGKLILTGDWCLESKIESAFVCGLNCC